MSAARWRGSACIVVRMVPRLARGTVADVDEQVGEERVTLLAPVGGEVGPHGGGGAGPGGLGRGDRRKTLGPHGLLLVVRYKGERQALRGARSGDRAGRARPRGPRRSGVAPAYRVPGCTRADQASTRE